MSYPFLGYHKDCGGNVYLTPSNRGKYFYANCTRCRTQVPVDNITTTKFPRVRNKKAGIKRAPQPKYDYWNWKMIK